MAIIVRSSVPATEFALSETLDSAPEITFECERVVESEGNVMTLIWARGTEREPLETELERDRSVDHFELLDAFDEQYLYRMELIEQIQLVLQILTDTTATVLDASGNSDHWTLRILYPQREELSQTGDFCDNYDLSFDIKRIRELSGTPAGRYNLTDEQFDALTAACEKGYFDVPRGIELGELSDELGISHQALSERLRRGNEMLIKETLLVNSSSQSET